MSEQVGPIEMRIDTRWGALTVRLDPSRSLSVRDESADFAEAWENQAGTVERLERGGDFEECRWPDGTRVVVNRGESTLAVGEYRLPRDGFVVDNSRFRAFLLLAGFGQRFDEPSLFVLRSLDRLPIESSTRVRVFRGFGGPAVLVANVHGQMLIGDEVITREASGFLVRVEREATVLFHDWYG